MADLSALRAEYEALTARGLSLDLTRGKPSPEQLDLSNALLELPGAGDYRDASGTDLRNYGGTQGLVELRQLFSDVLRVPVPQLLALGNASLNIMYDVVAHAMLHGVPDGDGPWAGGASISFLCPVPGYDRHFTVCEALGIRMIPVPMTDEGPDTAVAAAMVAADSSIKGMWCVPVHSNPTGAIYSERVVRELVSMPAATDFRLMWDNAYAVHHLTDDVPEPIDVLSLAAEAGNPNRPLVFASTSKITFPGAGVAFVGASPENIAWLLERMSAQTIGPDKINQLRHVRMLVDSAGVERHMLEHRRILRPRFDAVDEIFTARFGTDGPETWTKPKGGYFVSLMVQSGCARRAIDLARQAGIAVTPAGSTYPYHDDPADANIRIAPTFPPLDDLRAALDGLCTCVLLAEAEAEHQAG